MLTFGVAAVSLSAGVAAAGLGGGAETVLAAEPDSPYNSHGTKAPPAEFPHAKDPDHARPLFHYTLRAGWIGDPVPFYDPQTGLTHLFSVCTVNATAAPWERQEGGEYAWCHASGRNIEGPWTTHKPALEKWMTNVSADESGNVTIGGTGAVVALPPKEREKLNASTVILTGGGVLWKAKDKDLIEWAELGPITVPKPPIGVKCNDLSLSWSGHKWRLLVGGTSGAHCFDAAPDAAPLALLYEAPSLMHNGSHSADWKFRSVLHRGPEELGPRMEALSYFMHGPSGKSVLLWSSPSKSGSYWAVGDESASAMIEPKATGRLEWGYGYAAKTYADPMGRQILYSSLRNVPICTEWESDARETCTSAYAGSQSIPRELVVGSDHRVRLKPTEEFLSLVDKKESKTVYGSLRSFPNGDIRTISEFTDPNAPLWVEINATLTPSKLEEGSWISAGVDIAGMHAVHLLMMPESGQQGQEQGKQQQGKGKQQQAGSSSPTKITMRVDNVAGVEIRNNYLEPPPSIDVHGNAVTRPEWEQKSLALEATKFHWQVSMLLDRSVVEAFAEDGAVAITSLSDRENSNFTEMAKIRANGTLDHEPGALARSGTLAMWCTNAATEFTVRYSHIKPAGGAAARAAAARLASARSTATRYTASAASATAASAM